MVLRGDGSICSGNFVGGVEHSVYLLCPELPDGSFANVFSQSVACLLILLISKSYLTFLGGDGKGKRRKKLGVNYFPFLLIRHSTFLQKKSGNDYDFLKLVLTLHTH